MSFMDTPTTFEESSRKWSDQQQAVFDKTAQDGDNILVQACAGSGKTTTIVQAMNYAGSRPVFLAFNKTIQTELSGRISTGEAKTLNALGFAAVRTALRSVNLDAKKNLIYLEKSWATIGLDKEQWRQHSFTAGRLMGIAKNLAVGIPGQAPATVATFAAIAEAYWSTFPEDIQDAIFMAVTDAFNISVADKELIDFDDQLYYPVRYGYSLPTFTDAFVDECQDLSPIQHLLLEKLGEKGTRIIAVGDRYQAIYGFRGASHDSMDALKTMFSMIELPLSTTYRCPQLVVAEAQRYCPTIFPREGAPLGLLEKFETDPEIFGSNTLVICRNNAPMFRTIMRHVRKREPVRVLSNFLESFQGFIKGFKCSNTAQLRVKVDAWYEREKEKAEDEEAWGKLAGIEDRYETLCVVMEGFTAVTELLDFLKQLSTSTRGPLISTIHKAKGLEADRVYLLRPDLLPSRFAQGEKALRQEHNLSYVAITRALEAFGYGAPK